RPPQPPPAARRRAAVRVGAAPHQLRPVPATRARRGLGAGSRLTMAATVTPRPALPTSDERRRSGREARARTPRSSHGDWSPAEGRPDPVEVLHADDATRVPELVPIRYGRMLVSPFTFYRGAAGLMAAD